MSTTVHTIPRNPPYRVRARRLFVLFAAILLPAILRAQTAAVTGPRISFDHVSVEQGLSNFSVTRIAQDSLGFLWIGTEDGLNRYDGYTFRVYRPMAGDTTAISGRNVTALSVDRRGDLWVATSDGGLDRYDRESDRFVHIATARKDTILPAGRYVWSVSEDTSGCFWVATNHGIYAIERRTGRYVHFGHDPADSASLVDDDASAFYFDRQHRIWVGTPRGIDRFDPERETFRHYRYADSIPGAEAKNRTICFAEDGAGRLWAGTMSGLHFYDAGADRFRPAGDDHPVLAKAEADVIFSMTRDRRGVLWIGTFHLGLLRFDATNNRETSYRHDAGDRRTIDQDRVSALLEDRAGELWVGTYRGGLNRYDRRRDRFTTLTAPAGVYAIFRDSRNTLWVGTQDAGLLRYDPAGDSLTRDLGMPELRQALGALSVLSITEDTGGALWFGTSVAAVRFDPATGKARTYRALGESSTSELNVTKIVYRDRHGRIWAGTTGGGLGRYAADADTFHWYRHNNADTNSIAGDNIWSLTMDRSDTLWIGTFGLGVDCFDERSGAFRHYGSGPSRPRSLWTGAIYCIAEDSAGFLWLGTFGGGLSRFERRNGLLTFTERDGLPDNFVKGILLDDRNRFWLSTDKGLCRFDPVTHETRTYRDSDGLHGNVFLSGASFRDRDGRFWFGGEGGMSAFFPDSVADNPHVPPVAITGFDVLGQPRAYRPLSVASEAVTLPYDQNFFGFEFVALDFSSPEKNRYSYILEGLESHWSEPRTRRYANYTHVPPGDYIFRVRGSNCDNTWNMEGASFRVTVLPPFWETWWFRLLAVGALLGLGAFFYNYRVNRLIEIERIRVKIASDLHDDVGSTLSKISLQSELIQEGIEPDQVQRYLRNIAELSRGLVTTMSDIVWSIDARNDSTGMLLAKMKDFGTSTLSARQCGVTFAIHGFNEEKKLPVAVRENVYMIFKEAINNIVKHSAADAVTVELTNSPQRFRMIVADTGPAGKTNPSSTGHGIRNMKMRAERLGGTLEILQGTGYTVMLTTRPL